jgi:hypothetical protein
MRLQAVPDGSSSAGMRTSAIRTSAGDGTRFTPMCIGTASLEDSEPIHFSVHPHVRGDGPFVQLEQGRGCGSPPRAWGRLTQWRATRRLIRFTPTCVGTAPALASAPDPGAVHPHVRGDGSRASDRSSGISSSPPRGWGRRLHLLRAGRRRTVHPHVRGDGQWFANVLGPASGSPPRAWGRRARRQAAQRCAT